MGSVLGSKEHYNMHVTILAVLVHHAVGKVYWKLRDNFNL